jgi:hypothetical protein
MRLMTNIPGFQISTTGSKRGLVVPSANGSAHWLSLALLGGAIGWLGLATVISRLFQ